LALAGLQDRAGIRAAVTAALRSAPGGGIAVAVVGLDRFSGVNAALGRAAGDEVIAQVAARLASVGTALGRVGGDELAVLAVGPDAGAVGERAAAALETALEVDGRAVFLGASIGVARGPLDGLDAAMLLEHADIAMQLAKERGGGLVLRYAGALRTEAEHRLAIASGLQQALQRDELVVHYQPIFQAASRQIVGVEALVRWRHPTLGMIPPDEFIPVAEDTGLIVPLGEWVLDRACRQASRWQQRRPLRLAVNLSARQLEHQHFDEVVARTLGRSGLDPGLLDLELTERSVLHDHEEVAGTLDALRLLGVGCSVDDFGTGFGGLSYLIQLPVTEIKIDRSFVREIEAGGSHAAIISSLIRLAGKLHLRVVAEGVETEAQASFLEVEGCHELQGFLLSKPIPADGVDDLLRTTPSHARRRPATAVPAAFLDHTRPAPVRPGPRRMRRRLAPVIAAAAVGCALTAGAPAGAIPAFGQRTIAAVADVVHAGWQHVDDVVSPDSDPADTVDAPSSVEGSASRRAVVTPPVHDTSAPVPTAQPHVDAPVALDDVAPPIDPRVRPQPRDDSSSGSGRSPRTDPPLTPSTAPDASITAGPGDRDQRDERAEPDPAERTPARPVTPNAPAVPPAPPAQDAQQGSAAVPPPDGDRDGGGSGNGKGSEHDEDRRASSEQPATPEGPSGNGAEDAPGRDIAADRGPSAGSGIAVSDEPGR
jgi:diguanylate cyclase (GGDEF)-like protein